jgi:diguanylate cyclase (GGDEF)-like protein
MPVQLQLGFAVAVAGVAVAVWSAAAPHSPLAAAGDAANVATLVVAGMLCLARPLLVRVERAPWLFLGLAVLAWSAGDALWSVLVADQQPPPAVSLADAAYLPCYPLLYVALVLLIRAKAAPFPASVWVDGLIGALGLGAVVVAVAYEPIISSTGRSAASVAIGMAYPVGDAVLVGLVLLAISVAGFREPTWWLIAAAGGLALTGDLGWLLEPVGVANASADWTSMLWPVTALLFATAAWQRPVPVRTLRLQGWPALAMPTTSVVGALAVLVVATRRPLPAVGVAFAVASVAGALLRAVLTIHEVRAAAGSQHQAVTDELTGLGNRRLLLRRLDAALADRATAPDGRRHALLLLDLDRFKEVNDTLGHPVGDELLRRLGPRLAAATGPGQTLARLGGDEFGLLLPDVADEAAARRAAEQVLDSLAKPFAVAGLTLYVSASIGIAVAPEHGEDSSTLLRCADVAMYEAKRKRRGHAVYRTRSDRHTRSRLESATVLRRALETGHLICHYQPQLDLATQTVVGFEALARWQHPRDGLLSPAEFLALAEQTGLMTRLTDIVLAAALAECRRWRDGGHPLQISVNLAASTLLDAGLVERVGAALDRAGLPAAALIVEITEETLVADAGRARETLAALHRLGVSVSIDDYGVGYSSLSYLRDLPADELKLDRSFVTALGNDPRASAIVRYTVELAHALDVAVVAEGVEDADTLQLLRQLRCDRVQGHYVAKPMDARAVAGWLRQRSRPPSRPADRPDGDRSGSHDGDFTRVHVTLDP